MLFHSQPFILGFLPIVLSGFFLLGRFANARWALVWLVLASLFFHGWWNPRAVPLLVLSIAVNYWLGQRIARATGRGTARSWLIAGIVLNLSLLGWFKYADFVRQAIMPGAPALNLMLPLAISFFTFQQIMFLADAAQWKHREPSATAPGIWPWPQIICVYLCSSVVQFFTHGTMTYKSWVISRSKIKPRINTDKHRWRRASGSVWAVAGNGQKQNHYGTEGSSNRITPLPYAAFVVFFPHLIAGPLVRPRDIVPQLENPDLARPVPDNIATGTAIFLLGLAKKLVLADMFGTFADTGFNAAAQGHALTFFEAWYATLAYSLQIYFDFSGYSDMATGLARMMNVRFPLNFNSPYQARDIADFWRRWHITLGQFLRDHVYIPLGGNRWRGSLLITMLLCGLWHGAGWQFLAWGGIHGLFLTIHAAWRRHGRPLPAPLAHGLTLFAVIAAWVPFRAADLPTAWAMLSGMAACNGIALPAMIVHAVPPLAALITPVPLLPHLGDARTLSFPEISLCLLLGWIIVLTLPHAQALSERARGWALTVSFAFTVQALFFASRVAPFLYFQF